VALDGTAPRKIGEGHSPAVSSRGDRVAFVRKGQVWWASVDGKSAPSQAIKARGQCAGPVWSPDGARLAFVSGRGDHGLIGVYDPAAQWLRYLDPGTDSDIEPEWSPDGRSVAFIRIPSSGLRAVREPHRSGEPWSIRVAAVDTGAGREIWRAPAGPGSVFREVTARNQLLWAGGGRIVFPGRATAGRISIPFPRKVENPRCSPRALSRWKTSTLHPASARSCSPPTRAIRTAATCGKSA